MAVLIQRRTRVLFYRAGSSDIADGAPVLRTDSMRLASISKAFSGAVALALVADGRLRLTETVGHLLAAMPRAWRRVTLRELLNHTSGIPDFSQTRAFALALRRSPLHPPSPRALLSYAPPRLDFRPGTRFRYSNSDNVIVALMAQAATGQSYNRDLRDLVLRPLGLRSTSLPRGVLMAAPVMHGYVLDPPTAPQDVTGAIAAGWAWAAGGIVSTPLETSVFIRAYVRGMTASRATEAAQFRFRPGDSEPPGPGVNAAGLAIFRYQTRCGTVYGHTGNTLGYTQFAAATRNGTRSVVVSVNTQFTPATNPSGFRRLRHIYVLAVCAALAR